MKQRTNNVIFVGPYYLTVSSSGPAGEKNGRDRMGVYRQSGEYNNKPVWSRQEGQWTNDNPQWLYYDNGKIILIVRFIMMIHILY